MNILLTLVKVHPGKKYITMAIDATITNNNTHTTVVWVEGHTHDLREKEIKVIHFDCTHIKIYWISSFFHVGAEG